MKMTLHAHPPPTQERKRGLLLDDIVDIQVYCDSQLDAHKNSSTFDTILFLCFVLSLIHGYCLLFSCSFNILKRLNPSPHIPRLHFPNCTWHVRLRVTIPNLLGSSPQHTSHLSPSFLFLHTLLVVGRAARLKLLFGLVQVSPKESIQAKGILIPEDMRIMVNKLFSLV